MAAASGPNFSSSMPEYTYHVFLSFRGKDTGKSFSDHLFAALEQAGIHTFKDDDGIERGDIVDMELQKAMEESKISLIVFSKDYASSAWCLDQLVKIMGLRKTSGLIVIPVFFDADPSVVWEQSKSFAEAFARHEEEEQRDKVERWRAALRDVTDLGGWDLLDRHQAEFIQDIVKKVGKRLDRPLLHASPYLVGIDPRVRDINMWVQDANDVSIAIIYGIGGIGKTTIAKTVYNLNLDKFEGCCFLPNVRKASKESNGLILLQRQLLEKIPNGNTGKINNVDEGSIKIKEAISCRRVFIVLDDVDQLDQVTKIIEKPVWLCEGSKVIITTRLGCLPKPYDICKKFKVNELDDNESLQLFSWYAFRQAHPFQDYIKYSESVINHCFGIPFALRVMGSSLFGKSEDEWRSELEKLDAIPDGRIQKSLRISYDAIQDDHDKSLFLDIACFFIGKKEDYVTKILDGCGFYTKVGIQNLIDRHLLTINEDKKLMMHPLLRDMGREIIRQESPEDMGKRSRLCYHKDSSTVLRENIGTEAVKGLVLDQRIMMGGNQCTISCVNSPNQCHSDDHIYKSMPKRRRLGFFSGKSVDVAPTSSFPTLNKEDFETKAFAKMQNIKLLQLNYVKLNGGFEYFPKRLIWLCWHGFPLNSLPSDLWLEKLVVLDMRKSSLTHVWNRTRFLVELKILNLSHSHDLVNTPDFSGLPNLERLVLKDCINLVEVHGSIGDLKKLVFLNLKDCKKLRKLPRNIVMLKSLEVLILSGCLTLDELPRELGMLDSLSTLHADATAIKKLNSTTTSIFCSWLSPKKCVQSFSLAFLPHSVVHLSFAGCCLSDDAIPNEFSNFPSLKYLNLSGNLIHCLPQSLNGLNMLESLLLDHCNRLQSLPELPTSLKELSAEKCTSMERITNLPNILRSLRLHLAGCTQLVEVQGLFKLEAMSIEMANSLGLFNMESVGSITVEMFNEMTMTSRRTPLQVLQECGICSIFLPRSDVPGWYNPQNEGSSVCFKVPPLQGHKISGLNICAVYTCTGMENEFGDHQYAKITNKSRDLKWTYSPTFYGIPEANEDVLWFSHWKLGDQLEEGDEVDVSMAMSFGYQVKKCGIHLLYKQEEEDTPPNGKQIAQSTSPSFQTFSEGNMQDYKIKSGAFYLCNHDFSTHQEISEYGWHNLERHQHLFEQ